MSGIANPDVIDLIAVSDDRRVCVLYLIETEQWGDHPDFDLMNEKLGNYVMYATQGQLTHEHPDLDGIEVRIQMDIYFPLTATAEADLAACRAGLEQYGIGLEWTAGLALPPND